MLGSVCRNPRPFSFTFSMLVHHATPSIGGRYIEADIRPDTRRWIETHYDIAVHPTLEPMGETYDIIALTEKTATAPEKKEQ